jgi:hypothetical protein
MALKLNICQHQTWDPVFAMRLKKIVFEDRTKSRPSCLAFGGTFMGRWKGEVPFPVFPYLDESFSIFGTVKQLKMVDFATVNVTCKLEKN